MSNLKIYIKIYIGRDFGYREKGDDPYKTIPGSMLPGRREIVF